MRVLVLGAGAIGGVFGARLIEAGAEVCFAVRPARAAALRSGGLVVAASGWRFERKVDARCAEELSPPFDLAIISCKAYDLDPAMESIGSVLNERTTVLPLLNGIAHYDWLDARFGSSRVAGGYCHLAATVDAGGTVRQMSEFARIGFGARPNNSVSSANILGALAKLFEGTAVECTLSGVVMQDVWEKFTFIAALASMTCLMRAAVGDIVAADHGRALMQRMFDLCAATAAHAGFPMRKEPRDSYLRGLMADGSGTTSSMLRDLEAGRRIESDHIVGDMLRRARTAGLSTDLLETAFAHLQAHDARLRREASGRLAA